MILFAGVDYEQILRAAEREADVVVWDGGNNDMPFFAPSLSIVVADALRPDHGIKFHPGEVNLRCADVVIVNKQDSATPADIKTAKDIVASVNPRAEIIDAISPISVDKPDLISGKRVLVIEDGPTLTHGGMTFGAGVVAARKFGAKELIDPRPYAVGEIKESFVKYPAVGPLLPALGYGATEVSELEATIRACDPEVVIIATPADLRRILKIDKPVARVRYELAELGPPRLEKILSRLF
jgi:predicted GTPase